MHANYLIIMQITLVYVAWRHTAVVCSLSWITFIFQHVGTARILNFLNFLIFKLLHFAIRPPGRSF